MKTVLLPAARAEVMASDWGALAWNASAKLVSCPINTYPQEQALWYGVGCWN